jgi:hypothetical protein
MKTIPLTRGQVAMVDDADFEHLSKFKWYFHPAGYAARDIWNSQSHRKLKTVLMHREIMAAPAGMDIDHADDNGCDNQRHNLRIATRAENMWNREKRPNTSSVYKGVYWDSGDRKWIARITKHGVKTVIGYFDNERHAAMAYDIWARAMFGQFARPNFKSINK